VAVAAGESFSAAVSRDGVLFVWGCGTDGQLGLDSGSAIDTAIDTAVDTDGAVATAIDTAGVGATSTGSGSGSLDAVLVPTPLAKLASKRVIAIAAGNDHMLAVAVTHKNESRVFVTQIDSF
jgi:alpha-tubulin suppressor-like RCC1 family protein